ncbi:MAG TPA: PD-(D/E)XK nuclease family protein [Bryobacteraceae bacterium]|nr:PD-(D/E)XK nuclease family protein [Bryobacteraceae bacterium]
MNGPASTLEKLMSPLALKEPQLSESELVTHFRRDGMMTFVAACLPDHVETDVSLQAIAQRLPRAWSVTWRYVPPQEIGLLSFEPVTFACFQIRHTDTGQVQKALQKALLGEQQAPADFELGQHGFLIDGAATPRISLKNKDLVCHSFQHHPGVFYRFRYRRSKLAAIPPSLAAFFTTLPQHCPHHVFTSTTNARASAQDLPHCPAVSPEASADVLALAAASISYAPYKTRHENLERYFLEYDEHCIATEVPVWAIAELPRFPSVTGHIDVLRFKAEQIEVWDYKPNATEEKMAALQVQLYCEMLSRRTGLPLERFVAGYFDESKIYRFDPTSFRYL